jgi:hypothetical protein
MNLSLKQILFIGILAEALILAGSFYFHPTIGETFRHAARYSGRLSALLFLYCFFLFSNSSNGSRADAVPLHNYLRSFAVLHLIHFFFLASNVYLNKVPLLPVKLLGGGLGYLLIITVPFLLRKISRRMQMLFFFYLNFVMFMTYLARIKGDFVGAQPHWIHYVFLISFILAPALFIWRQIRTKKQTIS